MKRIVILSPSRYSLYATTVAELIRRKEVEICAIVVRRLVNPSRFQTEFRRDGTRLLRKIWKKLVLREKGYRSDNSENIVGFRRRLNIRCRNVDEFGKRWGTPIVYCNTLNDDVVVEYLRKTRPDLVVFTGGGLIGEEVLGRSGQGVLNCHMGILPWYRGMDVVEWPILERKPNQLGVTVHFMDRGVDTGDILTLLRIDPRRGETRSELRTRFEPIMCEAIVDACIGFLEGKIERKPQGIEDGKQYFIMHPLLIRLVEQTLARQAG